MANCFSTIITADYFPRALALYRSIARFDASAKLKVLVADGRPPSTGSTPPAGMELIDVSQLMEYPMTLELYNKYAHTVMDEFRWAMKPVFISYLLDHGYDKVIYLDGDMYFVNDWHFLFDELSTAGLLLTPNWNSLDPLPDQGAFLSSFTGGIFSAGFIGATKAGQPALAWWARACHFKMGAFINIGISNDQRYLDVVPVYFESTRILRHRGCNIGSWNFRENQRTVVNGETRILDQYPVIFIHFDATLVQNIMRGHDPYLAPYLQDYKASFEKDGYRLEEFLGVIQTHTNPGLLKKIKWKLRLRSRARKILYAILQRV
jgi:hypothetical protein